MRYKGKHRGHYVWDNVYRVTLWRTAWVMWKHHGWEFVWDVFSFVFWMCVGALGVIAFVLLYYLAG